MYRVAINGLGRIGRAYLRSVLERGLLERGLRVVGVNDLWDTATLAHLLAYDSTYGKLAGVSHQDNSIAIGEHTIPVFRTRDPEDLPWDELDVDLVIESTGKLRTRDDAGRHLKGGARKVLISAPGKSGVDATVVLGVNDATFDPAAHDVISAASCTTNCAAPMVKVLHDAFGVERGFLTTVHAYTNDQALIDAPHKDLRRARSAAVNIIPTSTGAAKAIGLVIPEMAGRLDGVALRVPVEDGSLVDLAVQLGTPATAEEVNAAFARAAEGGMAGVLSYARAPIVSRDIVGDPASCVFDAALTQAAGTLVKVFGWYDNEWGYTNRLVDLTELMAAAK
jgi:glyceraldehyde 3-phosphate dehydrogenase